MMNRTLLGFSLGLGLLAIQSLSARADTIYLKNGSKFEGKVIHEGDNVVLVLENGSRLPFPKDKVERVETGPAPWEEYAAKAKLVKAGDAAANLELAKWCRTKRLTKRMEQHLAETIKADPDNAEAREMLGHEKVGGTWLSREEALKAKGYVQVDGRWLNPEEYAAHQAKERAEAAAKAELGRLEQLADPDAAKAEAARKYYLDRGKKSLQNLLWAAANLKSSAARLQAVKLINKIGTDEKVHSVWLVQAAVKEGSTDCLKEICAGIKARDDGTAMTYLVLMAAGDSVYRRRAAYCLALINDKRCFKALIGCIASQPKDTLPGSQGMNLTQMGNMTVGATGHSTKGMAAGEVVPAADSMEYISGKDFGNDVGRWMKWLDSLDKAPGGAVVDPGKR